jgi:hypothetical protein
MYCSTAVELIPPPLDKTAGQIHGGNISPLPEGVPGEGRKGKNMELK